MVKKKDKKMPKKTYKKPGKKATPVKPAPKKGGKFLDPFEVVEVIKEKKLEKIEPIAPKAKKLEGTGPKNKPVRPTEKLHKTLAPLKDLPGSLRVRGEALYNYALHKTAAEETIVKDALALIEEAEGYGLGPFTVIKKSIT